MIYHTRKLVKPDDLNAGGSLFGGSLLRWIDEEAAIYVMCQLDSKNVVTKFMSEINSNGGRGWLGWFVLSSCSPAAPPPTPSRPRPPARCRPDRAGAKG